MKRALQEPFRAAIKGSAPKMATSEHSAPACGQRLLTCPQAPTHEPETATITAIASPALLALRDATRELHAELDGHSPLTAPGLDTRAYALHAGRVLGWMRPLEAQLYGENAHWRNQLQAQERACKASWISSDLREAGHDPAQFADCPFTPQPASLAEAFGVSYVCEGATLGGAFLYKRLREQLKPLSLHWLQGYGAQTGPLWQRWQAALAEQVTEQADIEAASGAAKAAFDSFRRWVIQ